MPIPTGATHSTQPAVGGLSGHPRGLSTLFFTEMWERFSYYGMRALLILYMTAAAVGGNPGLGWEDGKAGAVYGLYTSLVYLLALPGGWVADRLWGQRRAVFVGGCIVALGHFTLAGPLLGLPDVPTFFLGLVFLSVGTGLLKPNVSTIVGDLYPRPPQTATADRLAAWSARRDAAFSIFYMGINIGALLGPFVCGTLGERVNWHWGFSAAGFGMIAGLVQYRLGYRFLADAGNYAGDESVGVLQARARRFYLIVGGIAAATAVLAWLSSTGAPALTLETFAVWTGYAILVLTILFFAALIFDARWAAGLGALFVALAVVLSPRLGGAAAGQWATVVTLVAFVAAATGLFAGRGRPVTEDQKRLMVIFWLFLLAAVFWSGFEQAGSSMNLFARDLTDRTIGRFEVPTTWLQNVNPFFIVVLAPVFGWLWTWLARRHADPSTPVKFALGLLGLAGGFFVLAWGAANATAAGGVSMAWLVVTYFLHTCGELALSPVGLSSMTKLAPAGRVGQMMGVWFIAAALGNLFAGLVAGRLQVLPPDRLFWSVALFTSGFGVLALVASSGVRRLMGGAD